MKKKFLGVLLITGYAALFSGYAEAAEGSGVRGGEALQCPGQYWLESTYRFLDYYENESSPDGRPTLSGAGWVDNVNAFIRRLERLDPELANEIRGYWETFPSEFKTELGLSFLLVIDANIRRPLESGCSLVQAAIQSLTPGKHGELEKRYMFDTSSWKAFSEMDKAGLVIHELLYRVAISRNPDLVNSDGVRYFNGVLSSASGSTMNPQEYAEFVERCGLGRKRKKTSGKAKPEILPFMRDDSFLYP